MKIACYTLSFGKYDIFFPELHKTIFKNFLPDHDKHIFIYSDVDFSSYHNTTSIYWKKMGWPYDTMMRFHLLNKIHDQILQYDYIFFFNVNMLVCQQVGDEVIPTNQNDYLVGAKHPMYGDCSPDKMPYERNVECSCYIPYNNGKMYFQGCFNGGSSKEFLKMSRVLATNLNTDNKKNIIPVWHDESQLNWYYAKKNPLILDSAYIHPELFPTQQSPKMIARAKELHGGHDVLRS